MSRNGSALLLLLAGCNPVAPDAPAPGNAAGAAAAQPANQAVERQAAEDGDAPVAAPEFSSMGSVRCVTRAGWAVRDCTAGVVRNRDAGATITIFHPEGRSRDIAFDASGRAIGIATAEGDGSDRQPFAARRSGAATIVTLGPERYEIPDALVRGN